MNRIRSTQREERKKKKRKKLEAQESLPCGKSHLSILGGKKPPHRRVMAINLRGLLNYTMIDYIC
jgi:hypothetical protein